MNKIQFICIFSFLLGCQSSNSTNDGKVNHESISEETSSIIEENQNEETISSAIESAEDIDSILLRRVSEMYEWYFTSETYQDFPVTGNDTMFTEIDWQAMEQRIDQLRQTGFFADEFLLNFHKIAENIDQQLKSNEMEYYIGYYPPYGNGANPWCNCQDYPDEFWKDMELEKVTINEGGASANWSFADTSWDQSYQIHLKKKSGTWKISYLQGFDYENFFL